jgi:hypothetical protein
MTDKKTVFDYQVGVTNNDSTHYTTIDKEEPQV